MGISIFVMLSMVMLILYNLSRSTNAKERPINNEIRTIAGAADTSWYEDRANITKERVFQETKEITEGSNFQNKSQLSISNSSHAYSLPTAQFNDEELQKAMSAPIVTNELTSESNSNLFNSGNNTRSHQGVSPNPEQDFKVEKKSFLQTAQSNEDYLENALQDPVSPYEVQAGTIIPGVLITGLNSDLPGQITGQVRSNVYDSIKGQYLLIPQGAKLVGLYDSQVTYGQRRLLIVWNRIIFPNGQSLNLNGMPGVDMRGYAGFTDQVNNHYAKIFSSVLMMSVLSAGAQLSQPQNSDNTFAAPSVGQTLAQSLGTNISNTATALVSKDLNVQPTIEIRPGYLFNISITKDMVFPGSYSGDAE